MSTSRTIPFPSRLPVGEARLKTNSLIVMVVVALLIGTAARISLLIIYPIVVFVIAAVYRFRFSAALLLLLIVITVGLILSFFNGWFIGYKLLALYYILPFLLLLFATLPAGTKADNFNIYFKCIAAVAGLNDIIGFGQFLKFPDSDDSFQGLFSQYSTSINGLMLLNAVVFFYYFMKLMQVKSTQNLLFTIFFLTSSVLGFYGAGQIICILAFILAFYRFKITAIIKTGLIATGGILAIFFLLLLFKPYALEYNMVNLQRLVSFDVEHGPRKIRSFYNYGVSYPRDPKDFLFGSGPGTFNSRSAFMVGSPSYFPSFVWKEDQKPYYFLNYAYTLWNEKNTSQALYLDGFRNQPFSTLLAFLGEYGLIFTLLFGYLFYRMYRETARAYLMVKENRNAVIEFRVFKFLFLLLIFLLLIDNYLEFPETMVTVVLGLKFAQQALLHRVLNLNDNTSVFDE